MTYEEFKRDLLALSPDSKCLKFIATRISQDNYRGIHFSQHYRYDFEHACIVLNELKRVAGNKKIKIRTTQLSNHPEDMDGTEIYCAFCKNVKDRLGLHTQDTMRKTLFVDFDRMGFINRYDKHGNLVPQNKRCSCYQYVSLTSRGKKLANKSESIKNKYVAFSKGLDMLSNNHAFNMFNLIAETDGKITRNEYTYFVSFLGKSIVKQQGIHTKDNIVSSQLVIELIKEYRQLKAIHKKIDETVKSYCDPSNFVGEKPEKRDFSNWINETEQTFKLLSTTIYFECLEKYKTLKLRVDKRMDIDNVKGLIRSSQEKENYFVFHRIEKCTSKTLHHIVPLELWQDLKDFKLLDDWKNMIYINNVNHAEIHDLPTPHCKVLIENSDFSLEDVTNDKITFKNGNEVVFSADKSDIITSYNLELLKYRSL